jgi:hypothetical protein
MSGQQKVQLNKPQFWEDLGMFGSLVFMCSFDIVLAVMLLGSWPLIG